MEKIMVIYDPNKGVVKRDGELKSYVKEIIDVAKTKNVTVHCANELLIEAFRVAVKKGEIDPKEIVFFFNGEVININKGGNLSEYPKGFLDTHMGFLFELLPKPKKDGKYSKEEEK